MQARDEKPRLTIVRFRTIIECGKIFLSYGGFYADQTVRPLFLRPSTSFYAPEHRHDDPDLAVQRRGRTFCVQHGRRHRSERGQHHVPGRDADRGGRLHARHRRQRGRRPHARRGPSRHGKPLFLDVRLCRHPFRRRSERGRCGVRRTHRPARRCERYSDGLLRVLRPYSVRWQPPFHAPDLAPAVFRCRGKAEHGSYPVHRLGRDQLRRRLGAYSAHRPAGRGVGDGRRLLRRRHHPARILHHAPFRPAPHRHRTVYP